MSESDDGFGGLRPPPYNIEAEKALLGAILVSNLAYARVSEFLLSEHFAVEQHGRIYAACAKLIERGQIADRVTLKGFFEQEGKMEEVGGADYLSDLVGSAMGPVTAGEYGGMIFDLHRKRQLIELAREIYSRASGGEVDDNAAEQIESAEEMLYKLASTGDYRSREKPFKTVLTGSLGKVRKAIERKGRLAGVTTGFIALDKILAGLQAPDLIILAGCTSMGKTALATNIACSAAEAWQKTGDEGAVVGFFSLEMSAEQLATRILADKSGISTDDMRKGKVSGDGYKKLVKINSELQELPLFIDDTPGLTVAALRTRARRMKRQHGLGLIIIDYLQFIQAGSHRGTQSRYEEITGISRGLKALAKELEVPVLALSQLSRAPESRRNKRPQLSDLRDSGSIEQDADVVMFIYRDEYYLRREKPKEGSKDYLAKYLEWQQRMDKVRNKTEINVAKQRNGPVDTCELFFAGDFTRFGNLAPQEVDKSKITTT